MKMRCEECGRLYRSAAGHERCQECRSYNAAENWLLSFLVLLIMLLAAYVQYFLT